MSGKNWHTSLFDELGKYWAEIADARETGKETEFIDKVIETKGLLLDLCCGTGRHSLLLAQKRWNIIGFDISPNLLRIAKERMKSGKHAFPLVRGDIQNLPFHEEAFTAAISMFTSLGYLISETEDIKSLTEVARTLKRNGHLLIDIANREHLLQVFQKKDWGEFPGFYMLEKRTLDSKASKLHSRWTILDKNDGKTRTFNHNLRLYTLPQLRSMLQKARLEIRRTYGDYDQQLFQQDSPRLIILARKRA